MKGDPQILDALNEILTAELTAINQYYIHAKMCENWRRANGSATESQSSFMRSRCPRSRSSQAS